MAEIVISEFMDASAVARLAERHDVLADPELHADRAALGRSLATARALIVRNRTRVDRTLLEDATDLVVVGRLGVGLDNIDLDACGASDIAVRPARGANARAVAEYVIGAAMVLLRPALAHAADIVAGEWPRSELVGSELGGRRLALYGYGATARRVAVLARAFEMEVGACDPWIAPDDPAWSAVHRYDSLEAMLPTADVVSLHVPLTEATRHVVGADAFRRMKRGAILINAARGGVVDELALLAALDGGGLAGAALDVFEEEPPGPGRRASFAGRPNLLLTPHVAGLTAESERRVSSMVADEVLGVLGDG